jgi:hypothetical protein
MRGERGNGVELFKLKIGSMLELHVAEGWQGTFCGHFPSTLELDGFKNHKRFAVP